ncbi:MAG: GNAT family N-acetyltransferase [Steroidobacteraceae bacterium]
MPETLVDNVAGHRFELATPAGMAFIAYRRSGNVLQLLHAEVPPALGGRGLGTRLVRETLDLIRSRGERIVPVCPFIVSFVARHAEYASLVQAR